MAHASEEEAFSNYVKAFPSGATLLIDTYDTLRGARRAAAFKEQLKGVRLDSGDLLTLSQEVRKILDENGCQHAKIVASGDLNEYSISALLDQGAAIDTFGVGTELVTSRDAPALGGVYKLVEQEAHGQKQYRAKFSAEKASYPAAKQVYRVRDGAGHFSRDVLALAEEAPLAQGEALLIPVFLEGKQVAESPLEEARARCQEQLSRLPSLYKLFQGPSAYPVERSSALEGLFRELKRHYVAP
jgi:nicotinate phosphoribosyltransferase